MVIGISDANSSLWNVPCPRDRREKAVEGRDQLALAPGLREKVSAVEFYLEIMEYQRRSTDDQWMGGGGRLTYSDFVAACGPSMKGFKDTPATPRLDASHPPWLQVLPVFKHAPYYVDSDDDSGIGHSNGGQGERVSSTSSTETDGTPDSGYPPSLINNFRIRRSRGSQSAIAAGRGNGRQPAPLRIDTRPPQLGHPWSAPAGSGRLNTLHGEFRPTAVSTPEGKNVASGQVFDPAKFFAARPLPSYEVAAAAAAAASIQRRPSIGRGGSHHVPENFQEELRNHQLPHPAWRDVTITATGQMRNDRWPELLPPKRTIPGPIVNTPKATPGRHRYHRLQSHSQDRPPGDCAIRRVRSYCGVGSCGDSSLYSNVYENAGDGGDRTDVIVGADPMRLADPPAKSSRDPEDQASGGSCGFAVFGTSQTQHYDKLPPTRPYLPPTLAALGDDGGGSLQRAKSASLASLITVDSAMVHVRACPASVIPASEMGDVNSTMSGSLGDLVAISGTNRQHFLHHQLRPLPPAPPSQMMPWRSPPPPPLPIQPPAAARSPPSPGHYRIPPPPRQHHQQTMTTAQHYDTPPRRLLQQMASVAIDVVPVIPVRQATPVDGAHSSFSKEQVAVAVNSPSAGDDVAYAKVNKPRSRANGTSSNETLRLTSVDDSEPSEEVEPPLPPRNYKRNLAKNKKLSGSRGSLAEKMQGFTRTAKQVLRKAFSLEALNCKTDPALNESLDWDNEDDWSRVVSGPTSAMQSRTPRTVSAVKARDAAKRDRQQHARWQSSVASSASPASSSFFSSANSSNRSSPVSQQTLC